MNYSLLVGFSSLFWGQNHCWFDLRKMSTVWTPLNVERFAQHLAGKIDLGVYCINDRNQCYWGCVDIDEKEDWIAFDAALTLRSWYESNGIKAWVERSRSKGYHVWLFFSHPVNARPLQSMQNQALEDCGIGKVEVNPKQVNIWKTNVPKTAPPGRKFGIGNLVRIPYSPNANLGRMVVLDQQGHPLPLPVFVSAALDQRAAPSVLSRFRDPDTAAQRPQGTSQGQVPRGGRLSDQDAYKILEKSRTVGIGERDQQFYTMAKLLHATGMSYSTAIDIITDIYWSQVEDHTDFSLEQALAKVEREYG